MKLTTTALWTIVALPALAGAQVTAPPRDSLGYRPAAIPGPSPAAPHDTGPAPRGTPTWRPLGPFGGDVEDIAISPTHASIVLAGIAPTGSVGGTLYRSTDSGATWFAVPDLAGTSVYDIEFTPAGVVWVATDNSVWKSTNDGQNFTQHDLGIGLNDQTFAIEIDPTNPQVLWAAVADALGNQHMNVLKSINGGTIWADVTPPGGAGTSASDIAINPADPNAVMVTFAGAFGGGAVFFSPDGGTNWTDVSAGLPNTPVRAVRHDHGRWFIAGGQLFGSQFFGLWTSVDNGQNWTRLDDATWPRAIATGVAIDPNNQDVILAATVDGLHRSVDGGTTWTISSGGTAGFSLNSVRSGPGSSTSLAMGAASYGVILSSNGGTTTRISSTGIGSLDVFSVAANPANHNELAVAFQGQNNGGVYVSTNAGATWQPQSCPGTRYNYVRFDGGGVLYALSDGPVGLAQEGVYRRNPDTSWTNLGPFQGPLFETELYSIDFGHTDPNLFLTGGNDFGVAGFEGTIWRSGNAGAVWNKVYENIAGEGATVQRVLIIPDGTDQVALAAISTFSSAPINGVFRSTSAGVNWTRVSGTGLPATLWGYDLTMLPGDPHSVLVADGSFSGGGMYLSHDSGATWSTYFTGFNTRGVAVDPTNPDNVYFWTVFAATSVHLATGGGTMIQNANGGLGSASPRQIIAVSSPAPRLLLATTAGAYALGLAAPCPADFNGDSLVNSQDFFDFLNAFFSLDPSADFNGDTLINSQDFFDFLNAFFAGCP